MSVEKNEVNAKTFLAALLKTNTEKMGNPLILNGKMLKWLRVVNEQIPEPIDEIKQLLPYSKEDIEKLYTNSPVTEVNPQRDLMVEYYRFANKLAAVNLTLEMFKSR